MPYNTTAIPPRKAVTGQTQLPLSRVKKIISQDQDIGICSNNAAFAITVATEMFIQHIAQEALTQAKTERKPRRNIQYKDVANAVHHQDNLEFLEDLVPRTAKFKEIKAAAAAQRAALRGERAVVGGDDEPRPVPNGKKHKPSASRSSLNGGVDIAGLLGNGTHGNSNGRSGPARPPPLAPAQSEDDNAADPNDQLQMEMRQARGDGDVDMSG